MFSALCVFARPSGTHWAKIKEKWIFCTLCSMFARCVKVQRKITLFPFHLCAEQQSRRCSVMLSCSIFSTSRKNQGEFWIPFCIPIFTFALWTQRELINVSLFLICGVLHKNQRKCVSIFSFTLALWAKIKQNYLMCSSTATLRAKFKRKFVFSPCLPFRVVQIWNRNLNLWIIRRFE